MTTEQHANGDFREHLIRYGGDAYPEIVSHFLPASYNDSSQLTARRFKFAARSSQLAGKATMLVVVWFPCEL